MNDKNNQELVKQYLSEASNLLTDKKELEANLKDIYKKNEDLKNLIAQKKEIDNAITKIQEDIASNVLLEKEKINAGLKMIKESLSKTLEVKPKIANKLISFYKTKYETNENELDILASIWLEIFEKLD